MNDDPAERTTPLTAKLQAMPNGKAVELLHDLLVCPTLPISPDTRTAILKAISTLIADQLNLER